MTPCLTGILTDGGRRALGRLNAEWEAERARSRRAALKSDVGSGCSRRGNHFPFPAPRKKFFPFKKLLFFRFLLFIFVFFPLIVSYLFSLHFFPGFGAIKAPAGHGNGLGPGLFGKQA